ncbi:MAG: type II toxin-antitoxin system VapC family toxin [Tunicatimonas sp.]|uniref:type II toxin-antitoxin system VapC family toxin n=1 Tax=Tunicatimonas sp. TaxID=1940096 RepID=UPI003C712CDC
MNLLLNSNTIIYLESPRYHDQIKERMRDESCSASAISVAEVLGYSDLLPRQKSFFETFFKEIYLHPVDYPTIQEATRLRQYRKLSLGDAIVAATASIHQRTLVTANIKDFKKLQDAIDPSLDLINPLEV